MDPTQELEALRGELAILRQTNAELVAKNKARKDRTAELEAALAERDGQLATANGQLKAIQIDAPLKQMAESLSVDVPIFLDTFKKQYEVQIVDGGLALRDKEGKPVHDKDGKVVAFERESLLRHLSDEKHPHSSFYSRLLIASKASGASTPQRTAAPVVKRPKMQFGLR